MVEPANCKVTDEYIVPVTHKDVESITNRTKSIIFTDKMPPGIYNDSILYIYEDLQPITVKCKIKDTFIIDYLNNKGRKLDDRERLYNLIVAEYNRLSSNGSMVRNMSLDDYMKHIGYTDKEFNYAIFIHNVECIDAINITDIKSVLGKNLIASPIHMMQVVTKNI